MKMNSARVGLARTVLALYLLTIDAKSQNEAIQVFDSMDYRAYIQLNVLMVGQSGTGKTSCINSIFNSTVIKKKGSVMKSTSQMTLYRKVLPLKHADLDLRVIDTIGYGDSEYLDQEQAPIMQLIKDRLIRHKLTVQDHRLNKAEGRIHLVIYFIDAHRFKGVDIRFIEKLTRYAKVAVVISKADSLTDEERLEMKTTVQKRLIELNKTAPDSILRLDPYAVLCESRFYKRANVSWDVDNREHSDLPDLRADLLIRNLMSLDAYANKVYTDFHGTPALDAFLSYLGFAYYFSIPFGSYAYSQPHRKLNMMWVMLVSLMVGLVLYWAPLYLTDATGFRHLLLSGYFMDEVSKYDPNGTVRF